MKAALIILGLMCEVLGLLFLLQGAGIVRWPASSFMIDQSLWIWIGGAMILAGSTLYFVALRRR